jgi:hypothetical protein
MGLTQVLRVLADHVHVAEDVRELLHDAIDAEAEARGEPKREKVATDAADAARAAQVADLKAQLAALEGDDQAETGQ